MFAAIFLFASLAFAESKALALQICLDREGLSPNTIDGQWGRKSERALAAWFKRRHLPVPASLDPDAVYDRYFADSGDLFRIETVTAADLAALVAIPADPAGKAALDRLGYESILEMFAERGHVSQTALQRMNPGVDWQHLRPGTRLVIPDFPPMDTDLAAWPRKPNAKTPRPTAALVKVSLSQCEVRVYDDRGRLLALFPCSIARDKAKLPDRGELKITVTIAWPNYTYTPDYTPPGEKIRRHILPAGPNTPIGVAWIGLNLPGYGIHGTVRPESIGNAESHGCFRLANWNAARLYALVKSGTKVIVTD